MRVIELPPDITIAQEVINLSVVCERAVFVQEFWRQKENTGFALTIAPKLREAAKQEADSVRLVRLSDDEHEALEKGMKLQGQVIGPDLNMYYLQCLQAVYSAKTEVVLPKVKT